MDFKSGKHQWQAFLTCEELGILSQCKSFRNKTGVEVMCILRKLVCTVTRTYHVGGLTIALICNVIPSSASKTMFRRVFVNKERTYCLVAFISILYKYSQYLISASYYIVVNKLLYLSKCITQYRNEIPRV